MDCQFKACASQCSAALFLSRIWPTVKGQEEEISDVNCDNRDEIIVHWWHHSHCHTAPGLLEFGATLLKGDPSGRVKAVLIRRRYPGNRATGGEEQQFFFSAEQLRLPSVNQGRFGTRVISILRQLWTRTSSQSSEMR